MRNVRNLPPLAIDPLIDMVFKLLFGTEANKDILLDFLNAVLAHLGIPLAVSVELVPPRNLRRCRGDKETEVDVRAKDASGRVFQIEVQLDPGGPLVQRMIYGTGLLYATTIVRGEPYSELKPVVSIWVLRDRIPHNPAPPRPVSEYRVRDSDGNVLHDYPVIAVIELQNWVESAIFKEELERWLYFFVHGKELSLADDLPPPLQREVFMKAVSEMKRINDSLARRLAYNSRMDKLSWSRSLEVEAEARRQQDEVQRQQDEVQRQQDEVQRQQDEQFRLETVRMQQEADRKVQIALEIEAEMKGKLAIAFRRLLASGYREDEVVALLGIDPNEPKL